MKCPKCGAKMLRSGLTGLAGTDIMEKWRCPRCGYTIEKKREHPSP